MMTNTRWFLAPILVCLGLAQDVRSQDTTAPVDLTPYLVQPKAEESGPSGFKLAFAGEAGHRLQFQYGAKEAVELQVSVGYPAGGARTLRRLLEPSPEATRHSFDLGPLLAHGPYRPIPAYTRKGPQARSWRPLRTGWWVDTQDAGKYLVTVMARRVQDGKTLFTTDLRLPVQTWVGADLDRLAYIDDNAAKIDLWLEKGAPVAELAVEVDIVEARTGVLRSSPSPVRLTRDKAGVSFDLTDLEPQTYHVRVRPRLDGRLWDDGVRRALYVFRNGPPPKPEPPIEIPVAPQLFLDDFLIDEQRNLKRVFHPARKLDSQPLVRADRHWEGHAVMVPVGSRYEFNEKENRYELEYNSLNPRHRLLAVSSDGVKWTKPDLGLVEFEGSRANNILEVIPRGSNLEARGSFGGLWDYRTRGVPDLRTASMVYTPKTEDMFFLRGTYLMVRDSDGVRYLTTERPFMRHHSQLESLDNPNDNLGPMFYDERTGELVLYFAPHPPAMGRGLVRYDNKWAVSRNLGRMTTRDGVNWHRSYIWAPPREHPKHQSYGMQRVKQIGDLYVAFFPLYDCGTQQMDVHIWVSRNGIHWEDVGGDQAWIPNGPAGSFDHGIVYSLIDGPVDGDRSEAFYHGTNTLHFNAWILNRLRGGLDDPPVPASEIYDDKTYNGRPYLSPPAPVGPGWAMYDCIWSWRLPQCNPTMEEVREAFWAELETHTGQNRGNHVEKSWEYEIVPFRVEFRTNGFASRRAGEQEGVLTTHPLIFQGSRLTVNAAAGEGQVTVEVLDERGHPVPGYAREDCLLESFDSTRHEVRWREESNVSALRGQPVRLRFYVQKADLYGFQIR